MAVSADIIDRIDELIDEQLAAGEPETGWDYGDPDYPECPHCGRDWHGLPITGWGPDDIVVLCEGSDLIGPRRPPQPPQPPRAPTEHAIGHAYFQILVSVNPYVWARFREEMERIEAAFAPLGQTRGLQADDWYSGPVTYDEAYRLRAEPPACLRDDINWTPGPHNWHYEMQKPPLQFPRSPHPFFRYVSPAEALIRQHWDAFNAPEYPLPEQPGYDFTKYDLDPVHGVFAEPRRRGRR